MRAGARVRACTRVPPINKEGMEGVEGMDKNVLGLIRQAMPGVLKLVAEKRQQWGDAHVTECQRRGLAGEPGWFFAREGALAIGTPWADGDDIGRWLGAQVTSTQAVLVMRPPAQTPAPAGGQPC